MTSSNVERFDRLTGGVFGKLYQSFPVPIELNINDFTSLITPLKETYEEDQTLNASEFFYSTLSWLKDSGYITYLNNALDNTSCYGCVLTAKGLEVLKAVPKSVDGDSLGGQLADAVKEGAMGKLKELASEALSKGYGAAIGAAMGFFS